MLEKIKAFLRVKPKTFEFTLDNGLLTTYAIRLSRGEGGKPDKKLAARLRINRAKLERKRSGGKSNVVEIRSVG